jgi:hypothetical protein
VDVTCSGQASEEELEEAERRFNEVTGWSLNFKVRI